MDTILLCLALTVFQEARGEPVLGQRAVATVVLNRARIRDVSVCDAVLEKGQFSWHPERYITKTRVGKKIVYHIRTDRLPIKAKGWKESVSAAQYALSSTDSMQNIEFFHATTVKTRWKKRYLFVFKAGNHLFYARNGTVSRVKVVKMVPGVAQKHAFSA